MAQMFISTLVQKIKASRRKRVKNSEKEASQSLDDVAGADFQPREPKADNVIFFLKILLFHSFF